MGNEATASRYENIIDIYIAQQNSFRHYYGSVYNSWQFETSTTSVSHKPSTKIAMVRIDKYIDIFYIDLAKNLLRYSSNPQTEWRYEGGVIASCMNPIVNPIATRFSHRIHVVCVDMKGNLVHVEAGKHTGWDYTSKIIKYSSKVSGLSGVGYGNFVFDIFFIEGNFLMHGSSLQQNNWSYNFTTIAQGQFKSQTACTRYGDTINVFCIDKNGYINQYITNAKLNWVYQFRNKIVTSLPPYQSDLTVLQSGDSIDIFYVNNKKISRLYSEGYGQWIVPVQIKESNLNIKGALCACRCEWNIDVFFKDQKNVAKHAYLTSNNGWSGFSVTDLLCTVNKPILHWQHIQNKTEKLGEGHFGITYRMPDMNIILKKLKKPDHKLIVQEIRMLDKVSAVYPKMCQYQLYQKGHLVGFSMKMFKGKIWDAQFKKRSSIFRKTAVSRVTLVLVLAEEIIKLQDIGVCHGDCSMGNLLIDITSQNSQKPKMLALMIDFGLSFQFKMSSSAWLSWEFLSPPETDKKPYNAVGVNAYQFGRVALQILIGRTFQHYNSTARNPEAQLKELRKVYSADYPSQLIQIVNQLVSNNVQTRIDALYYLPTQKQKILTRTLQKRSREVTIRKWHKPTIAILRQELQQDINLDNYSEFRRWEKIDNPQTDMFEQIFKGTITNAVGMVPFIGPILSAVSSFIFTKNLFDVDLIGKVVDQRFEKQAIRNSINILYGLRSIVRHFAEQIKIVSELPVSNFNNYGQSLGSIWQSINLMIIKQLPTLQNPKYEKAIIPSFILVANLHLLHLVIGMEKQQEWNLIPGNKQSFIQKSSQYIQYTQRVIKDINDYWNKQIYPPNLTFMPENYGMGSMFDPYGFEKREMRQIYMGIQMRRKEFRQQMKLIERLQGIYAKWRSLRYSIVN